jgi:hypothetical protein
MDLDHPYNHLESPTLFGDFFLYENSLNRSYEHNEWLESVLNEPFFIFPVNQVLGRPKSLRKL